MAMALTPPQLLTVLPALALALIRALVLLLLPFWTGHWAGRHAYHPRLHWLLVQAPRLALPAAPMWP